MRNYNVREYFLRAFFFVISTYLVHDKIYKYQKDKNLIVSHRYTDINFKNKSCSDNNSTDFNQKKLSVHLW